MRINWSSATALTFSILLTAGCSSGATTIGGNGGTQDPPTVASVVLSGTVSTLIVGHTAQLGATASDAAGNPIAATISWGTSNSAAATVSSTGLVTAVAIGSVTITAASGGHSATTTIEVIAVPTIPVAAVTIGAATLSLTPGLTSQFTATTKDGQGNTLAGRTVTWASSQSAVATISSSGLVTAVGAGTTSITAISEGITSVGMVVTVTSGTELTEERVLAQQGLSLAFASTSLQSQLSTLFAVGSKSDDLACYPLDSGGSARRGSSSKTLPAIVNFYFDGACARIYISETVTTFDEDDILGNYRVHASVVYTGPTGTYLGTTTLDEGVLGYGLKPGTITGTLSALGTFIPANGAPSVRLGMACALGVQGLGFGLCQGGMEQDFPNLGHAFGSVSTIALDTTSAEALTFTGTAEQTTGTIGGLTLTGPTPTSLVINGGSHYRTTTTTGGAASVSLFPPTPTGWTITDAASDEIFSIVVIDDITRSLTGTIKRISTGAVLATLTLDQSGTGVIKYSDNSAAAVSSWTVGQ